MDEKLYTPTIVSDTPFPTDTQISSTQPQTQVGTGNFTPQQTGDKSTPKKRIAVELLSTALNTRSRKILEKFDLQQSGGLQIGNFEEGISGDIRLTPNGLTGRNIAGTTTFALDTDGNLILVGELRSGTLITGDVIIDGDGALRIQNEQGSTILDALGIVSANNFQTGNANGSPNSTFTTGTYTTVSGSTLSLNLLRSARVLLLLTVQSAHAQTSAGSDMSGRVFYTVHVDDVAQTPEILIDTSYVNASGIKENVFRKVYSTSLLKTLSKGSHDITIKYKIDSASNITATLHTWDLTFVVLGN